MTKAALIFLLLSSSARGTSTAGATAPAPAAPCGAVRLDQIASWPVPADGSPSTFTAADFDRDGRADLVLGIPVGSTASRYVLWRSRGDGAFDSSPLPVAPDAKVALVADLDGDGFPDLLERNAAGFRVLLNDRTGGFVAGAPSGPPFGVAAAGDLDGDGHPDLVLSRAWDPAAPTRQRLEVLAGDGRGGFGPARETGWDTGVDGDLGALVVGDVDGDGHADVVVGISWGFYPSGFLQLFRGDGTGALALVPGRFDGGGRVTGLGSADVDRDGRPELLRGHQGHLGGGTVEVVAGGSGGLVDVSSLSTGPEPAGFAFADVTGDGWPDVLLSDADFDALPRRLHVYVDAPGGDLLESATLTLSGGFAGGDLDGDGRAEVVAVVREGGADRVAVFRSACADVTSTVVLPVAVATSGTTGARFDTELTLLNTSPGAARIEIRDGSAWEAGEPLRTIELQPGAMRRLVTSASGEAALPLHVAAGPLRLVVAGASLEDLVVAARVVSKTPGLDGNATLGIEPRAAGGSLDGVAFLPWLAEDGTDRTNLALVNPGTAADGDVTLRVTVVSTDPAAPGTAALPEVTLPPGGFVQVNRVLRAAGLAARSGFARLERVSAAGHYDGYAVLNDEVSSDGSLVPAIAASALGDRWRLLVPAALSTDRYGTELLLFNAGTVSRSVDVRFFRNGTSGVEGHGTFVVPAEGTLFLPDVLASLGVAGGGPGGLDLQATAEPGNTLEGIAAVARVGTRAGARGRYGVAMTALPNTDWFRTSRRIAPLVQDGESRSNLTIVVAPSDPIATPIRVSVFDRDGRFVAHRDLDPGWASWSQMDSVLSTLAPGLREGWVRVGYGAGSPGAAYVSVNDGAVPGAGSGDGAVFLGSAR